MKEIQKFVQELSPEQKSAASGVDVQNHTAVTQNHDLENYVCALIWKFEV